MRISGGFGARVRELRRGRGWSQAELGGDAYSGSYISYLESGRRTPTIDVARYIANRLDVDPSELGVGGAASMGNDLEIASHLMLADRHLRSGDWAEALKAAQVAETLARGAGRLDRAWEAQYVQCRTLMETQQFERGADLALVLAEEAATQMAPIVQGEALTLAAGGLRAIGRVHDALGAVTQALACPMDRVRRAEALMQAVAAHAELGNVPGDGDAVVAELGGLAEDLPEGHLLGRVWWTLGNAYHLQGETELAEKSHGRSAQLIRASVDLPLWSRLQRVIAHFRLVRGETEGVADQLAVAESAMTLTGRITDLVHLWVDRARLLHLEGDREAAREQVRRALDHDAFAIACPPRADAYELLGDVALDMGDTDAAHAAYAAAAQDFEAFGAQGPALAAWKKAAHVATRS